MSLAIASAEAQWQPDGVPVCTADGFQGNPVAVPAGGGGAIIVWADTRGPHRNVYAQRLDGAGVSQWSPNGVLVTSIFYYQDGPVAVSDGGGGAIVAWWESRAPGDANVYAQRFNSDGVRLWGSGGIPLCEAAGEQRSLSIISDGRRSEFQTPGAIVAWSDTRAGLDNPDIYAQAVDANGTVRWTGAGREQGVPVCTAAGYQTSPVIVTDGTGGTIGGPKGAIITWADTRGGGFHDIYAQRLNAAGAPQLATDGIRVCSASDFGHAAAFIGSGSAIIAWSDTRNGSDDSDIYAQRVSAGVGWLAEGLPVCQANSVQDQVKVISDGVGGAILAWADRRASFGGSRDSADIYAQRVDGTGSPLWTTGGVALCTATGEQGFPTLVLDATGGAIVAWEDKRSANFDIYVQRVDKAGVVSWTPNGLPVSGALADFKIEVTAIPDNAGSAIVAWTDSRGGIYANRLSGGVADVDPIRVERFRLLAPFPNPTSGTVSVSFELPAPRKVSAQVFGVDGRLVRALAEGEEFAAGLRTLHWDGRAVSRVRARNGVYFVRVRAGAESEVRKILIMQ